MKSEHLMWGGVALAGLVAMLGLPKVLPKARMAVKRAAGTTYKTGGSSTGARATADPARGFPA